MNIRVLISVLTIVVALFFGGIMTFIIDHPVWSYVLWGLAGILLFVTSICYFMQKCEKHNPNIRWL